MTFATFFFRFFIDRFPQYVVPINSNATLNHSTAHSSLLCHFSLLLLSFSLLPSVTSAWRSTLVAFNFWLKWQTLACVCSTTFSQRFYRKIHICERPSALSLSMYPMWKVRLSFFMANFVCSSIIFNCFQRFYYLFIGRTKSIWTLGRRRNYKSSNKLGNLFQDQQFK